MRAQLQNAFLYITLFCVRPGVVAFPISLSVRSHQGYPYVAALLTICFFLVLLFFTKWIYLSRRRRKQPSSDVETKSRFNLRSWDLSSSSEPHSVQTNTQKSAFLVGLLGSPSWETRYSAIFDKVSAQLPFGTPYSSPSSPCNHSTVNEKRNNVLAVSSEDPLVQPHVALLRCAWREHDPDPAVSPTSKKSLVWDNSAEGNSFTWQLSFSSHPQKSQSLMLYDKETAMRQISGLDASYKLLPLNLGTDITSPKPALPHPRQTQHLHWQQTPQRCLRDPQASRASVNLQAGGPSWPSFAPKVRLGTCEIDIPMTVPRVLKSETAGKIHSIGTGLAGLTCIAPKILQTTPPFDSTSKCDIYQTSPLDLFENYHNDQHQLSAEEIYAPRPVSFRSPKVKSPTKRVRGSPKPGPSPLRTMCLPLDDSSDLVTFRSCSPVDSAINVQMSTSPDQSSCVVISSDDHTSALPLPPSTLWNAARPSTSVTTSSRQTTNTAPRKRFKTHVDLQDELMGLLLKELVHETKEWDDSLFVNNNFKAMIDSSKSCGALEIQTRTRKRTNPGASRTLSSSSFGCLEDIPEVDAIS